MKSTIPSKHPQSFSPEDFKKICNKLSSKDPDLKSIINTHGYPPMWSRPNSFETLVHIILEQQVSIASALAALNKLREKLGKVTAAKFLELSDEDLRSCYFSRQKTGYTRLLAKAIVNREINLRAMEQLSDDEIRASLIGLKGVGDWTIDVYLIFVLRRADIFPVGDLAAVNALKQVKKLPKKVGKAEVLEVAGKWAPYRTVATMILWHYYLSLRARPKPSGADRVKKAIIVT